MHDQVVYAKDGWRFRRLPSGGVWMQRDGEERGIEFDASTWASIVAGVSVDGDYNRALDLHQGPPPATGEARV